MISNLQAIHDKRKSFYGKAQVIQNENTVELKSYNTIVAVLDHKKGSLKVNGYYSLTTARHINEFCIQNGFKRLSKKEMEAKITLYFYDFKWSRE